MKTAIVIGAGPRGRLAYLDKLVKNGVKIVGVADLYEENVQFVKNTYSVPDSGCFLSYQEMLSHGKMADIALICTNDRDHVEPFRICAQQGYHILLEKPISPFPAEVAEIERICDNYQRTVMICHVLRYTPFFSTLKQIISSGKIGKIMSINHNENMAWWFAVNNFVRGKWNNSDTTSPLILAKCCHDMDILVYLTGKKCLRLSSFGSIGYFNAQNAPEGAGTRCTVDCAIADTCPYNVMKFNINPPPTIAKFRASSYIEDEESLRQDMATSPWGRCVFKCDNNVADHQVVAMEFEDNITAVFTVSAFTYDHGRTIKVMGTLGEIGGNLETGELEVKVFGEHQTEKMVVENDILQHGGGDEGLVKAFLQCIDGDNKSNLTSAKESLHSHMMAFAAEESRQNHGTVVDLMEFSAHYKQTPIQE